MTAAPVQVREPVEDAPGQILDRAAGIELLGDVDGSGYKEGAALVRRADGQIVHLGPLMFALLELTDGRRSTAELAKGLSEKLGRECDEEHVHALAQKLAAQGLLAGTEQNAPERSNPLLALRCKVLITSEKVTRRLTVPFTFLFHRWIVWPVIAAFVAVVYVVLFREGLAGATADAFDDPNLLVLVFGLGVLSAAFHELGHAAACRYGGGKPAGMGFGLYMVWPAFYTDVTDAYRLPRRDRLRVDLGGIYFNAIVSVATGAAWLVWHVDALLLVVGLQLLMMVKNLSPVIRADGYHILADVTGVPDLYAHIAPTLRALLPWRRREPSALKGRARLVVTLWVLVVVPVLLSLMLGAVLLLPRLLTTVWDSGRATGASLGDAVAAGDVVSILADCVRLVALTLPVLGGFLIVRMLVRMAFDWARTWSAGSPIRRAGVTAIAFAALCGSAFAMWPAGQYQPVRATDGGTVFDLASAVVSPAQAVRPQPPARVELTPGKHLALAMVPVGGATKEHPAFYFLAGDDGQAPAALLDTGADASTAFPFKLPSAPGPGGTQALAVNTTDGSVQYKVAYALVTVHDGDPVTNTNSAFAFAQCKACTTVAVSFQVVLIVGTSKLIAPIDVAGALNNNCPACMTTAVATQIVVTLSKEPPQELVDRLNEALKKLDALPALGGTPAAISAAVAEVQKQIDDMLRESGLLTTPEPTAPASTSTTATTTTATTPASTTPTTTASPTETAPASTTPTSTQTTSTQTTTTEPTTTEATTTTTPTTTATTTTTPG
jgi:putative peptide zinc metalloprotease protein